MDIFFVTADAAHIKKERAKAKELRKTSWWKQQLAKGACHYCGASFPAQDLSMDHIVPVARGGKSQRSNLVTACKQCNSAKSYHTPAELILRDPEFRSGME